MACRDYEKLRSSWSAAGMYRTMTITVNGETREVPTGLTVSGLLARLALQPDRVAVEYNRDILARQRWGATPLRNGDNFEIVHLVGGG
jgi:thiamine biosynthesis protein ThiS